MTANRKAIFAFLFAVIFLERFLAQLRFTEPQ